MNSWVFFLIAVLLVGAVLFRPKERFQPEFLDKSNVRRTLATIDSSYAQRTNHAVPAAYPMEPIQGVQSPFQVNQYKAYIL